MNDIATAWTTALHLIVSLDAELMGIVMLSMEVSLTAVALAAVVGLPFGAMLAVGRRPRREVR